MLSEPNDPALKAALGDPQPNLGRLRTAAELIWDAAQASGINPQVILVTLNKEQGLVTNRVSPDRLQRALNHAMGFDCPDGSGCGQLFPGFYYQLFGNVDAEGNRYLGATKSLMRSFNTPGGRGPTVASTIARVGDSIMIGNTMGSFAGIASQQLVTMGNRATAALYRYTPHVFNGNYNFWRFFNAWFKYPNGTIIAGADRTIYIIQDGQRGRLPAITVSARKLDTSATITLSPTEMEDYPAGPAYAPPDDTVGRADDGLFVFIGGIMHPVSNFVLGQRKLDAAAAVPLSFDDRSLFTVGLQLTPSDGTVLRGMAEATAYLVEDGVLKRYSAFTFKQRGALKSLQTIPDDEIALYTKQGYVAPLDGTVIKSSSSGDATYLVSQARRLPLTPALFKNRGFKIKDVVMLESDDEMASIPLGPSATPAEGTYFSYGGTQELFLFKGGSKHPISPFVAKQLRITSDYSFEPSIAGAWPEGIAIAPRDGTLLKSDADPTVYVVAKGQLLELTSAVFKNRGFSFKNIAVIPDADLRVMAKGGFAPPKENSWFTTGQSLVSGGPIYLYKNGVKRRVPEFVSKQRGMTPDFVFSSESAANWPEGDAVAPRDGTLVKSDNNATVYLVSTGLPRPLSSTAFKRRGYSFKNVKSLPSADVDAMKKGQPIAK
jgi:hypothetical protein